MLHYVFVLSEPGDAFEMAEKVREYWHHRGFTTRDLETLESTSERPHPSIRFVVDLEHGSGMDFSANDITASVSVTSVCSWSADYVAEKPEEPEPGNAAETETGPAEESDAEDEDSAV